MRLTILSAEECNDVLNGETIKLVGNNGSLKEESYNGKLCIPIENINGINALEKMSHMFNDSGTYDLISNNCDHQTAKLVLSADQYYEKHLLPNDSFNNTWMYHENYIGWFLGKAFDDQGGY